MLAQSNSHSSLASELTLSSNNHAATKETNISVVVRVRPRSNKEVRENSAIVATTGTGSKSREVYVKSNPSDLSSKTFQFDKVFGSTDSQESIFNEVVAPILEEVLMGYNCTIFAYGQTGAGKTYTMEGDLESPNGKDAGIIPRTLYALFDTLEKESSEYSVRVSFLEIYNEELRDLLSTEENAQKLKIFEDVNRKGSNDVYGMERVLVNGTSDVISILQKGSLKRQTAATKMNEFSSRSHCIFTITVHIKETTPDGEELLKIGKLNLVDLAGSENIGRSGAENKRAKEAGSINQSLLALGRVINALVEKGPHIPYRESKLTRLLQDSLGGKTKTCIIAAISPAKSSIEETLSTLDYAHRAKNIRNKPEVNQKMTKRALLREYESQIERLKADLQATRDKNGVYLAKETYTSLVEEQQSRKDQIDEFIKVVQAKEESLSKIQEEYKSQIEVLEATRRELEGTNLELATHRSQLSDALETLESVQQILQEQKVLTNAHKTTELSLSEMANGLIESLRNSTRDIDRLYDKIERKSSLEAANLRMFKEFQMSLLKDIASMGNDIDTFSSDSSQQINGLQTTLRDYSKNVSSQYKSMEDLSSSFTNDLKSKLAYLEEETSHSSSESKRLLADSLEHAAKLGSFAKQEFSNTNLHISAVCSKVNDLTQNHTVKLESFKSMMLSKLASLVTNMDQFVEGFMEAETVQANSLRESLEAEVAALKQRNEELENLVAQSNQRFDQFESEVTSSVADMIKKFAAKGRTDFNNAVATAQETVNSASSALNAARETVQQTAETRRTAITSCFDSLKQDVQATAGEVTECHTSLQDGCDTLNAHVEESRHDLANKISEAQQNLDDEMVALNSFGMDGSEALQTLSAKMQEDFTHASDFSQAHFGSIQSLIQTATEGVNHANSGLEWQISQLSEQLTSFVDGQREQLSKTSSDIQCSNLSSDAPSGKTPRKRSYNIPTEMLRTREHHEILEEYRSNGEAKFTTSVGLLDFPIPEAGSQTPTKIPELQATKRLKQATSQLPRSRSLVSRRPDTGFVE